MKMYLVKYSTGSYDDYHVIDVFVTDKKSKATKYVTKFNKMLKKWSAYYDQYTDNRLGIKWIKDEHIERYSNRWHTLKDINNCYWQEVEAR